MVVDDMPLAFCGAGLKFELDRVDYVAPETAGRTGGVQAGFPRWTGTWPVATVSRLKSDEVRAFVADQEAPGSRFYGYEPGRERPRFHQDGVPFTHSPAGWSQAIGTDGKMWLTLTEVMPGMVMSRGDYVGFIWDDWKRAMVRATSQGVAQGDRTITFRIQPSVPALVPGDAAVTLLNPTCIMRIDRDQTDVGGVDRRLAVTGAKIVAHQELVA